MISQSQRDGATTLQVAGAAPAHMDKALSPHSGREGEAPVALLLEGATLPARGQARARYPWAKPLAHTVSERGRLRRLLPVEGATRAPVMVP